MLHGFLDRYALYRGHKLRWRQIQASGNSRLAALDMILYVVVYICVYCVCICHCICMYKRHYYLSLIIMYHDWTSFIIEYHYLLYLIYIYVYIVVYIYIHICVIDIYTFRSCLWTVYAYIYTILYRKCIEVESYIILYNIEFHIDLWQTDYDRVHLGPSACFRMWSAPA